MTTFTVEDVEELEGHQLAIEDVEDLRTLDPEKAIWACFVGDDHLTRTTLKDVLNRINAKTPGAETIDYLEKYMYAWECK